MEFDTSATARECLAASCHGLAVAIARHLARKYPNGHLWMDELVSECWLGILTACRTYDPTRPGAAAWLTHVATCTRRQVHPFARKHILNHGFNQRQVKKGVRVNRDGGLPPPVSELEMPDGLLQAAGVIPDHRRTPLVWSDEFWERVLGLLSPMQRKRLDLYFRHGLDRTTVGRLEGVTKQAIDASLEASFNRLAKHWPELVDELRDTN